VRLIRDAYYWQPTASVKKLGFHAEALGREPIAAFNRALLLNESVAAERIKEPPLGIKRDTVAALIKLYRSDPGYQQLAPKTRKDYGYMLDRIESLERDTNVADLTRRDLKAIYREVISQNGLAMANAIMRVWRILLGAAVDDGWIESNPASRLKLISPPARRRVWSDAERSAFCENSIKLGRRSLGLAVMLGWDTAQRPGDLLRLSWADWDGSSFPVTQGKTGARVRVPLNPEAKAWVEKTPRTSTHVIVSEATSRPFSIFHFGHEFARIRKAAGLASDLQFRDLRRTALTEAGDSGATDDELRAMSGHTSREVLNTYVVPSAAQAGSAQRKRQQSRNKKLRKV
jgi:integrase